MLSTCALKSFVRSNPTRLLSNVAATGSGKLVVSETDLKYFPHVGNRERVGFGRNGQPQYYDDISYPYPAIRFQANTSEIEPLIVKQMGDWTKLTLEEKKQLYRHSFRQTFAELQGDTPEWKVTMALVFYSVGMALGIYALIKIFILNYPKSKMTTKEYQDAKLYIDTFSRRGPTYLVERFDLDSMKWKDK